VLKDISLTEEDKAFLVVIEARIAKTSWESVVQWEVWNWLKPRVPKFLYFGEYELLPSKMNLADLALRVEQSKTDPKRLMPEHRAVQALLRMADISINDFAKPGGYEPLKVGILGTVSLIQKAAVRSSFLFLPPSVIHSSHYVLEGNACFRCAIICSFHAHMW